MIHTREAIIAFLLTKSRVTMEYSLKNQLMLCKIFNKSLTGICIVVEFATATELVCSPVFSVSFESIQRRMISSPFSDTTPRKKIPATSDVVTLSDFFKDRTYEITYSTKKKIATTNGAITKPMV